jgi:methionyl-tRNA formyltransferase
MKVALVSRFPRADTPAWKRALGDELLRCGYELAVVYSRSGLVDHANAGFHEFGFGLFARYLRRADGPTSARSEAAVTLSEWAAQRGIPRHHGRRLCEPGTLEWVRSFRPDLLVLVGADVMPRALLEIPRLGAINPHYGLLPRYRGMNVTEWSIYHDDPVGVTVHAVDPGIDTGDILVRESVPVRSGATLTSIRAQQQQTSARLLKQTVLAVLEGTAHRTPQRMDDGRQFYRMHPLLLDRVTQRLADGYRWLGVEDPPIDEVSHG